MKLEWTAQELVHCVPVPDWVDHQPYLSNIPDTDVSCIGNGLCRLLHDVQVDLSQGDPVWHVRTAQRVLTREGAEHAAHVVADFDPAFQRLEVHFIRVVRGGEHIEHAKREAFQLLRREANLERLVFDGRYTASLLVPDVRVDDILELSVSVYGTAPALNGKYAAWSVFDSFNPWNESRQRLVRRLDRAIHIKRFNDPPEAIVTSSGGIEDSRWQMVGQRRLEQEPLTPTWLLLRPTLQFSEFESWNEVVSLFAPFYESDALPEALAAEADRLAATHEAPDQRAVEWLRVVQRELRYFAFSLGEGGLIPRTLDAIWSTRFGDCKDATKLYTAGARRLGLDACAALVSTTHGYSLSDFLPSSGVFNHCIVRLRLDGASYWLDPTVSVQSGDLKSVLQPHTGWALPLTAQTMALEKLEDGQPLHIFHVEDEITLGPKRTSPATLRRHVIYCLWMADAIRRNFANEGTTRYVRAMLKELQAIWPDITETASIDVRDRPAENRVDVRLFYEIRDCWQPAPKGSGLNLVVPAGSFSGELPRLSGVERAADIYLGRPRKSTSLLRLKMPCEWQGTGWLRQHEAPHVKYVDYFRIEGRIILDSREFVVDAWSLPAANASAYNDVAKKLYENRLIFAGQKKWFGGIRQRGTLKSNLVWLALFIFFFGWVLLLIIDTYLASNTYHPR